MAKAAEKRDERKRRVVDAGRRITEHSSGNRPSLILPSGLPMWSPKKAGAYQIDIIPYDVGQSSKKFTKNYADPGDLYFERTYFAHGRIGVNTDSYVCSASTFGKPCPVCEWRMQMFKSPRKEDQDAAKAVKASERQLWLVYDHAEPQKGVQLWEISNFAFGKNLDSKINNASERRKPVYRRFADPDEGLTLRLVAEEKPAGQGKFLNFVVDEFQEREQPVPDEIINHRFCLDDMVAEIAYDSLRKIFLQIGDEEEAAATQTDEPEPATDDERPVVARRGRAVVDEDPPADEPEPEPEPAKPAAKPAARKPAPKPDPEPEPEPEVEPEPEPQEEPAAEGEAVEWKKGMEASFEYRDEQLQGTITRIDADKNLAFLDVEGRERLVTVDLGDLCPVGEAPAEEEAPPPKPAPKPAAPAKPAAAKPAAPAAPAKPAPFKPAAPAPAKPAAPAKSPLPGKPAPKVSGWDD